MAMPSKKYRGTATAPLSSCTRRGIAVGGLRVAGYPMVARRAYQTSHRRPRLARTEEEEEGRV